MSNNTASESSKPSAPATTERTERTSRLAPSASLVDEDLVQEEEEVVDDGMEIVINVSSTLAGFNIGEQEIKLKPGQYTRVNRAYTTPIIGEGAQDSDPLLPVIMRLTEKRVVPAWHTNAKGHKMSHNRKPKPMKSTPVQGAKLKRAPAED